MNKNFYSYFYIFILLFFANRSFATHNRAGEITYRQLATLKYEFTLTIFTEVGSGQADREFAELFFGDQTQATQRRLSKTVFPGTDIAKNLYVFEHTFPAFGSYTISYRDENRNAQVLNFNNSLQTPFYVETFLNINPQIGFNTSSPVLLLDPIDFGAVGEIFIHNPNGYDPDGDSLSYKLVANKQEVNTEVDGYKFLSDLAFTNKSFTINPKTGEIIWDTPKFQGLFNIAIRIEEYRRGALIGFIIRDMQIVIRTTNNKPPIITETKDTCIVAGSNLLRRVFANDINTAVSNDVITLSASGGPFETNPAATFTTKTLAESVFSDFSWTPTCDLVRKEPYQIVFRAEDNGNPKLVDLETYLITVIAPAPENLLAKPVGNTIQLTWNKSICDKAKGYKIYRRWKNQYFISYGFLKCIQESDRINIICIIP